MGHDINDEDIKLEVCKDSPAIWFNEYGESENEKPILPITRDEVENHLLQNIKFINERPKRPEFVAPYPEESNDDPQSGFDGSEDALAFDAMEAKVDLEEIDDDYLNFKHERVETDQFDYQNTKEDDEVQEDLLNPLLDVKANENSPNMVIEDGFDDILDGQQDALAIAGDSANHEVLIKKKKVDVITTEVFNHLVEELMMDGFVLRELLKLQGDQVKGIKTNINAVKGYLTDLSDFIQGKPYHFCELKVNLSRKIQRFCPLLAQQPTRTYPRGETQTFPCCWR